MGLELIQFHTRDLVQMGPHVSNTQLLSYSGFPPLLSTKVSTKSFLVGRTGEQGDVVCL